MSAAELSMRYGQARYRLMTPYQESHIVKNSTSPAKPTRVLVCTWGDDVGIADYLDKMETRLQSSNDFLFINPVQSAFSSGQSEKITAILSESDGKAELVKYTLPGLYSTSAATEDLKLLYPGLGEVNRETVKTVSPEALRQRLEKVSAPIHIVIKTPGGEATTLNAIETAIGLDRVSSIRMTCSAGRIFQDSWSADDCVAWLKERQFRVVEKDISDIDWPVLIFAVDEVQRTNARLSRDLEAVRQQRDSLQSELAALQDVVASVTDQLTQSNSRAEAAEGERDQYKAQNAELEKNSKKLASMLDARRTEIDSEQKAHDETKHRLLLAREDIRRCEGQIALITDLLLRESVL